MTGSLLAVHIADGVLGWPVLAAGFAVAGVLALAASWRIREEEIPRVALLTAAFFVASSIHVRLGPTSVHLLLNGLVGVVLGWRAPLAILIGVGLQAMLIPHGGLTTIGVNATVQVVPALAAGMMFPWLVRLGRGSWSRGLLLGVSGLAWGGLAVFAAALLLTNPWGQMLGYSDSAGVVVRVADHERALSLLLSPLTLILLALFAASCAWLDAKRNQPPEFAAGLVVGAFSVLGTTLLAGVALVLDGAEKWAAFAEAVFLVHLPLALLEGLLLGVTVVFLARVKPELLRLPRPALQPALVGLLVVFAAPTLARAHGLEAGFKVDVPSKRVTVESWYETGDAPAKATAKVLRPDGSVLAEGPLDDKGVFSFGYEVAEPLKVEVHAPGGHKATLRLKASDLGAEAPPPEALVEKSRGRDIVIGLSFVLALAAFALSWRNAARLAAMPKT